MRKMTKLVIIRYYVLNVKAKIKISNKCGIETDGRGPSLFLTKFLQINIDKIGELPKFYPKSLRRFDLAAGLRQLDRDFGDISLS